MGWEHAEWEYETDRLRVVAWRSRGIAPLIEFVTTQLTEDVTRELPKSWQRPITRDDAPAWLDRRDDEGRMFLVEARRDGSMLGVFMFFPGEATDTSGEVRIGYVLAQSAWGAGYASEIVAGFAQRWDEREITARLLAGVTAQNAASRRVLEKAGFAEVDEHGGICTYERPARQ